MSIASTTFLFLFLPIAVGIYFLVPEKNNLKYRNIVLFIISIFFYAWGEPIFVLLLLVMIVLTYLLGKLADGRRKTKAGKFAVFLTVLINVGVILFFEKISTILSLAGLLIGKDLSFFSVSLPIGMSFFCFNAISYVVDIYRCQCKTPRKFLYVAIYLSAFFKVLQGPIVPYRDFESALEVRKTSWEGFSKGVWRLCLGFAKKMIIAGNVSPIVQGIFESDFTSLSMSDAWIGCFTYLIFIYFDFSGYSDMAIGLGKIFGFDLPENFNYPYISTSVGEYWRRWHITLCAWFRDYLYFPILLGPSIKFRKFLLRHNVNQNTAKTLQNIFVPSCVWIVTALWHGTNWNYTLWGVVNSAAIIIEQKIKPSRHKKTEKVLRWLGVMLILILTKPLVCTASMSDALLYFKAMFSGTGIYAVSDVLKYYLTTYSVFIIFGAIGCFPILPFFKKKIYTKMSSTLQRVWNISEAVLLGAAVVLSVGYLIRSGTVIFMYQQL